LARDDATRLRQALLQLAEAGDEGIEASEQVDNGRPSILCGTVRYSCLERLEARGFADRILDRYMGRELRVVERYVITAAGWSGLQHGDLSRVDEELSSVA
jgi:hypothetical protein